MGGDLIHREVDNMFKLLETHINPCVPIEPPTNKSISVEAYQLINNLTANQTTLDNNRYYEKL
jgi:hypothetical protein